MYKKYQEYVQKNLDEIRRNSLFKQEHFIESPQGVKVKVQNDSVINFCANNYLGLASHPRMIDSAKEALDEYGYGMASVRFICGTQNIHKKLEERISQFLGKEDTILYSSCFDANTGLFETLLGKEDAIFSDALNHASIIDGVRLCKAKRYRYEGKNLETLERQLKEDTSRFKLIATDGVFSMDGYYANLKKLSELAKKYEALLMVDDSHAVGFVGKEGKGTGELLGVQGDIDLLTGTLGKALGGASGGYVSGPKELIEYLRQKSRPYLFSNSLSPVICAASLTAFDLVENEPQLRSRLSENTEYFRENISSLGFHVSGDSHPIVPVMIYDDKKSALMAQDLLAGGVYAVSFSYPVVPLGTSRIRLQISASHSKDDLDRALHLFEKLGKKYYIL